MRPGKELKNPVVNKNMIDFPKLIKCSWNKNNRKNPVMVKPCLDITLSNNSENRGLYPTEIYNKCTSLNMTHL